MDNRNFLETWYRRVWWEEDLSAIDEMMADTAPVEGIDKTTRVGPDDFKKFTAALLELICETRVDIAELLESGEHVAVLMDITAKCRKSGKALRFSGQAMGQIQGGKIIYAHNHIDFISMFEQLGQLPENTMPRCLSGECLS